jgi:hypothetical protein
MHEYMHNRGMPPAAWQGPLFKNFRIPPSYTGGWNLQKECCTSAILAVKSASTSTIATFNQSTTPTPTVSTMSVPLLEQGRNLELWKIGFIAVQATLLFWALRVLVRLLLSNIHLENDAAERVTMTMTYLALLRRNRVQQNEAINAILMALFRPSGDGIVKDEGVPIGAVDMLLRRNP